MSTLYFILALFACAVSAVGGAFGMRFIFERKREIAEREDPRDTQIRDLQAKVRLAANERTQHSVKAASATEHVELAHERIRTLLDEIRELKNSLQNQEALRGDNQDEKELLRDKLSAATRQLDTLRQRNQELEVELSVAHEPEMLTVPGHDDDTDDADMDPLEPTIADNSPSLIQALSGELDRWKRHCHVLGDELKNQRERVTEIVEAEAETPAPIPDIDELTDIRGIGAVLARKFHMLGIYRYEDLMNLSEDGVERALQLIPDFERRMQRDNWLEQARTLHDDKYARNPEVQQEDIAALA